MSRLRMVPVDWVDSFTRRPVACEGKSCGDSPLIDWPCASENTNDETAIVKKYLEVFMARLQHAKLDSVNRCARVRAEEYDLPPAKELRRNPMPRVAFLRLV